MRLGVSFPVHTDPTITGSKVTAAMRAAERLGFDSLWFFDAIGRGFYIPDALIQATVAATVTERLEVGTCILQLPLRHPVDLAHRIITAQLMTGGRLRQLADFGFDDAVLVVEDRSEENLKAIRGLL